MNLWMFLFDGKHPVILDVFLAKDVGEGRAFCGAPDGSSELFFLIEGGGFEVDQIDRMTVDAFENEEIILTEDGFIVYVTGRRGHCFWMK